MPGIRSARNEATPERRQSLEERLGRLEKEKSGPGAPASGAPASSPGRRGAPARAGRKRSRSTNAPIDPREGAVSLVLLDCSASMGGEKVYRASEGTLAFASQAFEKGYRVGAISFGSGARTLSEPSAVAGTLPQALREQIPSGSTNLAAALDLARNKLRQERWAVAAVVVATDGYPDDPDRALAAASGLVEEGVSILTIGTEDADQRFLQRLASAGELATPTTSRSLGKAIQGAAGTLPELSAG